MRLRGLYLSRIVIIVVKWEKFFQYYFYRHKEILLRPTTHSIMCIMYVLFFLKSGKSKKVREVEFQGIGNRKA